MHLPESLYERAPHYWIFIGVLLAILGVYLGMEISQTYLLVGVVLGLASCAWGIRILMHRTRQRDDEDVATSTASAD